jgi:NAD(P)-dependent dehydrogenase (short-subunit alcohol dehydrogenase family)
MNELNGKVAVITGAGSGMGRATASVFVREGAKLLAADISGRQDETATELGEDVVGWKCDVSSEPDVEAMFAAALDRFGRVDVVLNVAGVGSFGMLADLDIEEYERVLGVNMRGVLLGTKHGINAMLPTGGGVIVNWSSIGGLGPSAGTSAYCASKAGVISITKSAAIEYGAQGIRANAICPGFVETELTGGPGSGTHFPQLIEASALKRAGQPEEVAEVASFLASDRASYITGSVIAIDGGTSAAVD